MPTYDFECESCGYSAEIKQGFDAPSKHKCPKCGKKTLIKVFINAPIFSVKGDPTTIGHLAERNTEKMGKYEIQDRNKQNNIGQEDKSELGRRDLNRKINKMTASQKRKWIKDGD
tara:strand:- start:752 stop:1096 length:345 start_codon:yes stop_codon:yes gene_type:complete